MNDIVEFLKARLDEDEARAQHALNGDLDHLPTVECRCGRRLHLGGDAVRVLREVEAKREILAFHEQRPVLTEAPMLLALAAVYADHPDYREEWRR